MSLATGSFAAPQNLEASDYANKVKRKKNEPNLKRSPRKRFMSEQTKFNFQNRDKKTILASIRKPSFQSNQKSEIFVSSQKLPTQH